MHRCWDIAELVRAIFDDLDPDSYYCDEDDIPTHVATLLHLAQTCRQFTEPALDLIWREHSGLSNVLKCLPADAWSVCDNHFKINSPLRPEDWDRALYHSKRIRKFVDMDPDITLDTSTLTAITSLPASTLLPNVQRMSLHCSVPIFPHIMHIVGQRIVDVAIILDDPSLHFSALEPLAFPNRVLNHLAIECYAASRDFAHELIPPFVLEMNDLRVLQVASLNQLACQHISTFSNMYHLWVRDLTEIPFPDPLSDQHTPFPALTHLNMHTSDITFGTNFIEVLQAAPLVHLSVGSTQNCDLSNAASLFSAVYTATLPSHLDSLSISMEEDNTIVRASPAIYTMPADMIHPLTGYVNLRFVSLQCPIFARLDDSMMDELARAWPYLERLFIAGHCRDFELETSHRTVESLVSLAHFCPRLDTLALIIDASRVPVGFYMGITHDRLRYWRPLESRLGSAHRAAEYLWAVFPYVAIRTGDDEWAEVGTLIMELQNNQTERCPSPLEPLDDLICF
ncbi:hypothetical protein R3P38DRAFT_3243229 [Favolaschia claudopus]|uniref:F-box domain-containing protein n=1 Tax=Favolaschia claudopus TaxID=2862362 RepID=A0AAV9Z3P5_9AGAR